MKKTVAVLLLAAVSLFAGEFRPGMQVMAGARYDDLRMCVASPAGTKGGPMADIAFMFTRETEKMTWGAKIPVFRPLLFAAAFEMVQFEPEFFYRKQFGTDERWVFMPGVGVSFHYGPDYESDKDNTGESFFAAGPILSATMLYLIKPGEHEHGLGLRPFVTQFWGEDDRTGTAAGISLEYLVRF